MSHQARTVPTHTHRSARKGMHLLAGTLLGIGAALGVKSVMAPADAPRHDVPEDVTYADAPETADAEIDLSRPHIISMTLDKYGTGVDDVAVAGLDDLKSELFENLLAGLPAPLREQAHNRENIAKFVDGMAADYVKRLPELREAFAAPVEVGNVGESRLLCVATGLSHRHVVQDLISNMTGLKMRGEAVGGMASALRENVFNHEYGHCFTTDIQVPVVRETLSDAYAMARHIQETGDFDTPTMFHDLRVAALVHTAASSHATAPFLGSFIQKAREAHATGALDGLKDEALMDKVKEMVLGAPEQQEQAMQAMADKAMHAANTARQLRVRMQLNPYTCRLTENLRAGDFVGFDERSPEYLLLENYHMALDNICGMDTKNRPTRAELYEADLQQIMEGQPADKQAEVLAFQSWRLNALERQMQQDGSADRAHIRDGYGLRLDERRAVIQKVSERLQPAPQPAVEREPSV